MWPHHSLIYLQRLYFSIKLPSEIWGLHVFQGNTIQPSMVRPLPSPMNIMSISKILSLHSNIRQRFNPKNSMNSKSQIWSSISSEGLQSHHLNYLRMVVYPRAEFSFHTPVKLGSELIIPLSPLHLLSLAPFSMPSFYFKYLHSCVINFLLSLKHMPGINHILKWLKEMLPWWAQMVKNPPTMQETCVWFLG